MPRDLNNPPVVQQSWDSFVNDYNLVLHFGMNALQNKLNAQASAQGQTYRFSKQDITEILPSLEERLEHTLDKSLGVVRKMHEQVQTPRGDNRPEVTNRNVLEQGNVVSPQRRLETAPWAGKFDIAADTRLQDAFNEFNNNLNQQVDPQAKEALVNQFKNKLKMDMRARLENKLALENKLTYKPSTPKPKRPGEF
ncbi:MAG: hypothetical protein JSS07_11455 [Proteobacteria bacterium]|nr:hypothetical protein [Pseudomonadota bacterium]